jgi:ketosteroid isomerase-like protein
MSEALQAPLSSGPTSRIVEGRSKMKSHPIATIVGALLLAPGCSGSPEPTDAAGTILSLEREWSDRFQAKDIAWITELHWSDARQLPPGAPAVVGAEEIRAAWKAMADTEGLTLQWEPSFAKVSGDLAYDVGKGALTTPDGTTRPVKYVVVWERRDGQWKVVVDMFSPDE